MKDMIRTAILWIPLGAAITVLSLLMYASVQQNYRQSLNDPQIQMAEDGAAVLSNGGMPADVVPRGAMVDLNASLAPWIAVYDATGTPLESSGILDGKPPVLPQGVLEAAKSGLPLVVGRHLTNDIPANENRISWQPRSGVRQATVVVWEPQTKQFVAAGRNMREVESREGALAFMVFAGWIATMFGSLFAVFAAAAMLRRI